MIERIEEPVGVLAFFSRKGLLLPKKFWWRERAYEVVQINQTHQARSGAATLHFFHCTDNASPYRKLCFNNVTKVWTLEETEVDV